MLSCFHNAGEDRRVNSRLGSAVESMGMGGLTGAAALAQANLTGGDTHGDDPKGKYYGRLPIGTSVLMPQGMLSSLPLD